MATPQRNMEDDMEERMKKDEMDMEDCIFSLGIEFECDKEVNKLVRSMREYRARVL